MVNSIPGDFWIRFTSPHPKDFSDKLIEVMSKCKKVTDYLNLPIQSGDNKILKKKLIPGKKSLWCIKKQKNSLPRSKKLSIQKNAAPALPIP